MSTKLNPRVFERAAERVAGGSDFYACDAIRSACEYPLDSALAHCEFLASKFKPEHAYSFTWWWCSSFADEAQRRKDKEARILALLLCAEMARDMNRKRKP